MVVRDHQFLQRREPLGEGQRLPARRQRVYELRLVDLPAAVRVEVLKALAQRDALVLLRRGSVLRPKVTLVQFLQQLAAAQETWSWQLQSSIFLCI